VGRDGGSREEGGEDGIGWRLADGGWRMPAV
jgi:hypothetical protein